jgi:hypothetical protein
MRSLPTFFVCVALMTASGAAVAGCGHSPDTNSSTHVSQSTQGSTWPFTGVSEGDVFCDPGRPTQALFRVTAASSGASEYIGQTWSISADEAYPLPPQAVWTGDARSLATYASAECR